MKRLGVKLIRSVIKGPLGEGVLTLQKVRPIVLGLLGLDGLLAELPLPQRSHRGCEVGVLAVGQRDLAALLLTRGIWPRLLSRHSQAEFHCWDVLGSAQLDVLRLRLALERNLALFFFVGVQLHAQVVALFRLIGCPAWRLQGIGSENRDIFGEGIDFWSECGLRI